MATSNSIKTSNDNILYEIDVTETATSISDNTSTITVNVNAWSIKDGYSLDYEGECYLKIDGVSKTLSSWSRTQKPIVYGYANKVNIYTGSFTILHNNDGTKSIQVAACFELYFDGYVKLTSSFKSFNVNLTTLNIKASEINAVDNARINRQGAVVMNLHVSIYNTNYTHELSLLPATGSTPIFTISNISLVNGINSFNLYSISREASAALLSYVDSIPDSVPVICRYVLTTYDGQNIVGSPSICKGVISYFTSKSNTIIQVRSTGITVNGDVNCTKLTQTTPNMEVNNGVLKILRW